MTAGRLARATEIAPSDGDFLKPIFPELKADDVEELARRLQQAAEAGAAVVPVGGGRGRGMGGPPTRCDVELHTTRLDRVLEHSQADMVVSVESGITLETSHPPTYYLPVSCFAPGVLRAAPGSSLC